MTDTIPGLRGIDHVGINVPDLDEAERFLVGVLGAVHAYTLGAKRDDDGEWMHEHLGVHPRTVISEIRFYRLGTGTNLEVFKYVPAEDAAPPPRNSDDGGHHLALYVDDLDAAVAHLRAHGVETMGAPTSSRQAADGQRWVYFRAPWGLQFELVSFPGGKAYERDAAVRLWHPAEPTR
ncbi:VOC family protein [Agromyces tropicus]|uniref:VOC family protein n=1 Tax=Agromyces tropicus TaxID=555371 RepID=A0ABP5GMQ6_9MICO